MKPVLTLALVAVAASTLDAAQDPTPVVRVVRYDDGRLTGITAVDVVVHATNLEACGISRAAVQDAAVASLRAGGVAASVSAKASSWFYTVYVTVESSAANEHCVTAVRGELMAHVSGIPDADRTASQDAWGSLLIGEMPLVRHSGLVSSTKSEHASRVGETVRDQLSAIAVRIKTVNATR